MPDVQKRGNSHKSSRPLWEKRCVLEGVVNDAVALFKASSPRWRTSPRVAHIQRRKSDGKPRRPSYLPDNGHQQLQKQWKSSDLPGRTWRVFKLTVFLFFKGPPYIKGKDMFF